MASAAYRFDYSSHPSGLFRRSESSDTRRQSMLTSSLTEDPSGGGAGGASAVVAAAAGVAGVQTTLVVAEEKPSGTCAACCPCAVAPGEEHCTVARAKSCVKMFLAQLFSHVGLCALVVAYAIMGAFIFMALERSKEFETRGKVKEFRDHTLDQLYNITGKESTSEDGHGKAHN